MHRSDPPNPVEPPAEAGISNLPRGFDWNDLRYVLELARTGTAAGAARKLRADHTTVRRRLQGLEEALGARLFDSQQGNYSLTAAGQKLLELSEQIESLAFEAQDRIAGTSLTVSGQVGIGAPEGFGTDYLAPRIPALLTRHPGLRVRLVALPRVFNLSKREADIAIALTPPNQQRQIVRKLTSYRLGLYASRRYLDSHAPIERMSDLRQHGFVGYINELLYSAELDYLPELGFPVELLFESSSIAAQCKALQSGAGIGVLPHFLAGSSPELQPVLPDRFRLDRNFWLVVRPDVVSLPRVRTVIDFISDSVHQDRDLFV